MRRSATGRRHVRGTPSNLTLLVGRVVRSLRLEQNLTQADLAANSGVAKCSVTDFEGRVHSHVTIAKLERYAHGLSVTASELIRQAEARRCEVHEAPMPRGRGDKTPYDLAYAQALGAALRARRRACGKKLEAVAIAANMYVSHVCEVERGEMLVKLTTLDSLARALGTTASELLREAES